MAEGGIGTHKILVVELTRRDSAEAFGETCQAPVSAALKQPQKRQV
jgi:hypothetical protein